MDLSEFAVQAVGTYTICKWSYRQIKLLWQYNKQMDQRVKPDRSRQAP